MASIIHPPLIDPSKSGRYPIIISEELLREDHPRKRQRVSVRYNHRPKSLANQSATINSSKDGRNNSYTLSIKDLDGSGDYRYDGRQQASNSLALMYHSEKQAFILDKIDTEFCFNLSSTPSNKDASSLATQYPKLETGESAADAEDLFGDDAEEQSLDDVPADPSNPYDYRHFLNRGGSPSPEPSLRSSPVPNHKFGSSPLLGSSSPIKRPRSRTEPKKAPRHRSERYLSPNPREEADADNEDSDPNELVIDMGDSVPKGKPWRSALGVLNEGGRNSGPISFRSAASSMSPSVRGESEDEKINESDHDVDEMNLGESRVDVVSHGAIGEEVVPNGGGWDDDDEGLLEAELEQAMEEQAESEQRDQRNGHQQVTAAESSEESEEE